MFKIIYSTLALVLCTTYSQASGPYKTFHHQFKQAEHVQVHHLKSGQTEIDFDMNHMPYKAVYDHKGHVIQIEHHMTMESLPGEIHNKLKEHFGGDFQCFSIIHVERAQSGYYEIELFKNTDLYHVLVTLEGEVFSFQ